MKKTTLVLGASMNTSRYSNSAIKRLRNKNIEVFAVGRNKGMVLDVPIEVEMIDVENTHTITMYLNPQKQTEYYNYIIGLKPKRVIFNPGTENEELISLLKENKIESEIACTLVLLSTNQY